MAKDDLGEISIEDLASLEAEVSKPPDDPKPGKKAPSKSRSRPRPLAKRLEEFFGMVTLGLMAYDPIDGQIFAKRAPELAKALDKLATENPAVKRMLEAFLTGSAWAEVIGILGGGIVLPIVVHHRGFPADINDRLAGVMGVELVPIVETPDEIPDEQPEGGETVGD